MVRVRFAPSPTGPLHIGGVRTALFNYLFAKKYNGTFVLRIEDTDKNRYVPNSENHIIDSLKWCGINIDEPLKNNTPYKPYRQSERTSIYNKYIQKLLDKDLAYYAFDTAEELQKYREELGKNYIYNYLHRNKFKNSISLSKENAEKAIKEGNYTIRFKCPKDKTIILGEDIIRGDVRFDTSLLDDKVLFKSDGLPTYHLASVVDDHLMNISHVIRGEEWLPSLGLHLLLYEALDWNPPKFAHLPLILKPNGKGKLSKRDSDKLGIPVFSVPFVCDGETLKNFKDENYSPEALVNFLALLGWNPKSNKEVYTLSDLIQEFSIQNINSSGAKFDIEKLNWYNQQHIRLKSDEQLADDFKNTAESKGYKIDIKKSSRIVKMVKERVVFQKDFWELSRYFFECPNTYDDKAVKKCVNADTNNILLTISEILCSSDDIQNIKKNVQNLIREKKIKTGQIMQPLRLALIGDLKGADLFDIIDIIGVKSTVMRIKKFIKYNE